MDHMIEKAEQQLLGFRHCHAGFSFQDLLESMNLERKEWEEILEEYPHYKEDKWMIEEIEEYFVKEGK